jgi:dTDP-4-dehydrorhamnose reductase
MTGARRWVIFGGTGNLGAALAEVTDPAELDLIRWGSEDLDLEQLIRESNRIRRAHSLEDLAAHPHGVGVILRKIRETEAVGVVNMAAYTDVSKCQMDPMHAMRINAAAAGLISAACAGIGIPCVYVSTDYVFGGGEAPYKPRTRPCPVNEYGKSKAAGERLVRMDRAIVARMSFLPEEPGYKWVFTGVRCTKEWSKQAARRLRSFLLNLPDPGIYHLVRYTENTLDGLVRQRFPDLPEIPVEKADEKVPFTYPADVRLADAWRPPEEKADGP